MTVNGMVSVAYVENSTRARRSVGRRDSITVHTACFVMSITVNPTSTWFRV
jgi:hypothetical protein